MNPEKTKKFYIMGNNSAILYAYELATTIGRKNVNMRTNFDDGDPKTKFHDGACFVADIAALESKLKENELMTEREEEFDGMVVRLKLHRTFLLPEYSLPLL